MAQRYDEHGGDLLGAFVAGSLMGAALALLFAPAPGDETREYLGARAREGRRRASGAARQGRELLQRQREQMTTAFERAREQYQATRDPDVPGATEEPEA